MRLQWLVAALLVASTVSEAAGQAVRSSVATDGTLANESSLVPSLSQNGRFVAFLSFASNLVPGDTNGVADIFLRDRDTDGDSVFDEAGDSPRSASASWGRCRPTARASIRS